MVRPSEWLDRIRETHQKNQFKIVYAQHPLADDLKNDLTPVIKVKNFKDLLSPFLRAPGGISTKIGLKFSRGGQPECRYSMTGESQTPISVLKRDKNKIDGFSFIRLQVTTCLFQFFAHNKSKVF